METTILNNAEECIAKNKTACVAPVSIVELRDSRNLRLSKYIGARLKERRLIKGITQTQLGDMLNVSFQQIQKYERGANCVNANRLLEFAVCLGVSINYFFEGFPEYEKHQGNYKKNVPDALNSINEGDERLYKLVGELTRIQSPLVLSALFRLVKSLGIVDESSENVR
jgi:transcriptional regulator with XRE-family HTH domain